MAVHDDCDDQNQTVWALDLQTAVERSAVIGPGEMNDTITVTGFADGLPDGASAVVDGSLHRHDGSDRSTWTCDERSRVAGFTGAVDTDGRYRSPGERHDVGWYSYDNRIVVTFADGSAWSSEWHGCGLETESFFASAPAPAPVPDVPVPDVPAPVPDVPVPVPDVPAPAVPVDEPAKSAGPPPPALQTIRPAPATPAPGTPAPGTPAPDSPAPVVPSRTAAPPALPRTGSGGIRMAIGLGTLLALIGGALLLLVRSDPFRRPLPPTPSADPFRRPSPPTVPADRRRRPSPSSVSQRTPTTTQCGNQGSSGGVSRFNHGTWSTPSSPDRDLNP